jgi:hypothetical protein
MTLSPPSDDIDANARVAALARLLLDHAADTLNDATSSETERH